MPALPRLALALMESSRESGLALRLVGSVAILVLMNSDGRGRPQQPKDIDLAADRSERMAVQSFLEVNGWSISKTLLLIAELRETYFTDTAAPSLDVFYDEIDGNHPISIKARLGCSWPTLSWTDLLLTKLQRKNMRAEDVWDVKLLMASVETVETLYFQTMLGCNWGLYTTVTDNLKDLKTNAPYLSAEVTHLQQLAASAPKSLMWKFRSIIGRRLKWWREMSSGSA